MMLRKYIIDRISWMPVSIRRFSLKLLFQHYHLDLNTFSNKTQTFESTKKNNELINWVKGLSSLPELFDFLELIIKKFGVRFLRFLPPIQEFLLQVLSITSSTITQTITDNPKQINHSLLQKKCLSLLNLCVSKFNFIDCTHMMTRLLHTFIQPKVSRVIDTKGTLGKNVSKTMSLCASQRELKIMFLQFPVLVDGLLYGMQMEFKESRLDQNQFLEILRKILSVSEEEQEDKHARFEEVVEVSTNFAKGRKIEIENEQKNKTQVSELRHVMDKFNISEDVCREIVENSQESELVEEVFALVYGQKLLNVISQLFARIKENVKGRITVKKLFSGGCLVEVTSLLLEKKASQFLTKIQKMHANDSKNDAIENPTDQLLDIFALPLNPSLLESQIASQKNEFSIARFRTLLHGISVLLHQSSRPDRFIVQHMLPLLQRLNQPLLLFEVTSTIKNSLENALLVNLSNSLGNICQLFAQKKDKNEEFDFEQVFIKLEEFCKTNEANWTHSHDSKLFLSMCVRFLRCSDSSCRNMALEIFGKYFSFLSEELPKQSNKSQKSNENSLEIEQKSANILQLMGIDCSSWSSAKQHLEFIRRVLLTNLKHHLSFAVTTSDQLRPIVQTLLTYSTFASTVKSSTAQLDDHKQTIFPYSDLLIFQKPLDSIFDIRSTERLTGMHALLDQLKTLDNDSQAKAITFKDLMIPIIERFCELRVRTLAENRNFKGKASQSKSDSIRNMIKISLKCVSQMLTRISLNDFKAFLKKKIKNLNRPFNNDLVGLELALERESKDFQAQLLLETLDMITRSGLGEDVIQKVTESMRIKLQNQKQETRLLELSENAQNLQKNAKQMRSNFTEIDNKGELQNIRNLTQQSLKKEMIIAGENEQLSLSLNTPKEQIGLDEKHEQTYMYALIQEVEDFNNDDQGYETKQHEPKKSKNTESASETFVKQLLRHLLKSFFSKGQKAKRTRRERRLLKVKETNSRELREVFALGEGVVKVARLLPFKRFKFEFSKVVIRMCELLGHPDEKLRIRARKSLASISLTTGPFVFGIVLREMRENLTEGKLQFVRNYSLAFILQEVFKSNGNEVFRCGDLDMYVEYIVEMALEEVTEFGLENRDTQFTKGHKWKEMRAPKGGMLFNLMGRIVDVNGEAVLEILMLLKEYLENAKGFRKAMDKVKKMLAQFSEGLDSNASFSSGIAFVLAHAQMLSHSEKIGTKEAEITEEKTENEIKRHDIKKTFEIQEGAAQGKSVKKKKSLTQERKSIISKIFCEFALGILEKSLKKNDTEIKQTLKKQGVDFQSTFHLVCQLVDSTKDLDIKSRCLAVILKMHHRALVNQLKTNKFEFVLTGCLKDLDGSRPQLVEKTFRLLPFVVASDADLHEESKKDLVFCVQEFLYLNDSTLGVADFVLHCLEKNILSPELVSCSDAMLEVFFETKNESVSKKFAKVLTALFRLPLVGPGLAKKLSFDLVKNLEKATLMVQVQIPFLLTVLFQGQEIRECADFLDMLVLEIEVFRANSEGKDGPDPAPFFRIFVQYCHLKLLGESGRDGFDGLCERLLAELELVSESFPGNIFCFFW